jgi:hypothetical protein
MQFQIVLQKQELANSFKSCIQVISATVISEFPIFISTSTYEDRNETGALDELQTTFL